MKKKSVKKVDNQLSFNGNKHLSKSFFTFQQFSKTEHIKKSGTTFDIDFPIPLTEITTWMHIEGVHDIKMIQKISKKFNIHRLAQQDIVDTTQRPKAQSFENFLFITTQSCNLENNDFEQISFVLGKDFLISFQETKDSNFMHIKQRIKEKKGYVCDKKEDYLFYLLIESILDVYFQKIGKISEQIYQKLNIKDIENLNTQLIIDIEYHKKQLFQLRKKVSPIKDIINVIERNKEFIEDTNRKYFFDLQDQCTQIIEDIDVYLNELESGINLFFSMQGHRTNQIVQTLTIVSTIFIPLTFLAGIYGMNFDYIPELKWKYGYFGLLGIMIFITMGLLALFKKRKWF